MIAIVQYEAGNIRSVQNALQRLGATSVVTDDPEQIRNASHVILPGVGEASSAMRSLCEKDLDQVIPALEQPVLGICLGLQLMCRSSEEGGTKCLGIFDTVVKRFPARDRVPHMGWNNFELLQGTLLEGVAPEDDVYYVHSYFARLCAETSAVCNYIREFSAALQKDNFYATQFHPEKSSTVGQQILKNFIAL